MNAKKNKATASRGSLKAATQKSKAAAAEIIKEHEFADSPFSTEPKLHANIRIFSVEITYRLDLERSSPVMENIADAVCNDHHTATVTVIGNSDFDQYPAFTPYQTHDELEGVKPSVGRVVDEVASYFGTIAANRLVTESNNRIQIKAVTVNEQLATPLLLDLTIE